MESPATSGLLDRVLDMGKVNLRVRVIRSLTLFVGLGATFACGDGLGAGPSRASLVELSGAPLDEVPEVARFELLGDFPLSADEIWLVEGEVSSVSEGRLRRREIPKTVSDKRVPLIVEARDDTWILSPTVFLLPGENYTFVGLGLGRLAAVQVSQEVRPRLYRWGEGAKARGDAVVYCAAAPPLYVGPALFSPPAADSYPEGLVSGLSEGGLGAGLCASARIPDDAQDFFLPPTQLAEYLIEPSPVLVDEGVSGGAMNSGTAETVPKSCGQGDWDAHFAFGCARIQGPVLEVEVSAGPFLFEIEQTGTEETESLLLNRGRAVFGPLAPDSDVEIRVVGEGEVFESVTLTSGQAAPHLILNEVLADPWGSEPASEWVEIKNVGTAPAQLSGYTLWDSTGPAQLPDLTLEVGEFGVIVRVDYRPGPDVVPVSTAVPVLVESLGDNGLRNSGEVVQLRDSSDEIVSEIPALAAREGQSVARMSPWGADVPSAFFLSGDEGPTPGADN